jgi:microcystin-dependent protein
MSTPYLGEIKLVAFQHNLQGWATCNGQLLPINQNQGLFSILGTMYGGNGQTNFALPDLRGRVPMHHGTHNQGERGGQEFHTVTMSELPAHTHFVMADNNPGTTNSPSGAYLANSNVSPYRTTPDTTMHPSEVTSVGGSQAHENRMPSIAIRFVIALQGFFPTQN